MEQSTLTFTHQKATDYAVAQRDTEIQRRALG